MLRYKTDVAGDGRAIHNHLEPGLVLIVRRRVDGVGIRRHNIGRPPREVIVVVFVSLPGGRLATILRHKALHDGILSKHGAVPVLPSNGVRSERLRRLGEVLHPAAVLAIPCAAVLGIRPADGVCTGFRYWQGILDPVGHDAANGILLLSVNGQSEHVVAATLGRRLPRERNKARTRNGRLNPCFLAVHDCAGTPASVHIDKPLGVAAGRDIVGQFCRLFRLVAAAYLVRVGIPGEDFGDLRRAHVFKTQPIEHIGQVVVGLFHSRRLEGKRQIDSRQPGAVGERAAVRAVVLLRKPDLIDRKRHNDFAQFRASAERPCANRRERIRERDHRQVVALRKRVHRDIRHAVFHHDRAEMHGVAERIEANILHASTNHKVPRVVRHETVVEGIVADCETRAIDVGVLKGDVHQKRAPTNVRHGRRDCERNNLAAEVEASDADFAHRCGNRQFCELVAPRASAVADLRHGQTVGEVER